MKPLKPNPKKVKAYRRKRAVKFTDPHPNGNRNKRRSAVAITRLQPERDRKFRISMNLKNTKEEGRKAKALKLEKKK